MSTVNETSRRTWFPSSPMLLLLLIIAFGLLAQTANTTARGNANPKFIPVLTATPTPTPTPCNQIWSVVSSPNVTGNPRNYLRAVAVVSANDVWAVGNSYDGNIDYALVEHWNGSQWSIVNTPYPGAQVVLNAVAVVSANDVWAVGYSGFGTLTEHWNGSQWTIVPSPNPSGSMVRFNGVAAVSTNDVWAVGNYYTNPGYLSLIEHWDGTQWSIVPNPNPGTTQNVLNAVTAVAVNDVWAVGYFYNGTTFQTLIEHWNGSQWSVVPSPSSGSSYLYGVAAVSANEVWAVGYSSNGGLAEFWNGSFWSIAASPDPPGFTGYLMGLTVVSHYDIWAVGYAIGGGTSQTLIEHWNGGQWSVVSSPNPATFANYLYGVVAVSPTNVWAVGYAGLGPGWQTLVERYNFDCATGTPTPPRTYSPTPTPTCGVTVRTVSSPDVSQLNNLTVLAANNVWAVGNHGVLHWDGTQWNIVPIPSLGSGSTLKSIAATSSSDVWVAGIDIGYHSLTLHWDGTQWTTVPSPSPGGIMGTYLNSMVALAPNDMWAVGYYKPSATTEDDLALHWNGTQWSIVPTPGQGGPGSYNLQSVSAVSPTDIWAVGYINMGAASLIEHWNGTQWSEVPAPQIGTAENALYGVTALSSNQAWAVGDYYNTNQSRTDTLALRWNGNQWSWILSPTVASFRNILTGVYAVSASEIWAVGYSQEPFSQVRTLVARNWSLLPSPNPSSTYNHLRAVAALSANDVWLLGDSGASQNGSSMVLHAANDCVSLTATPPGTPPTATRTPTATATPACALGWNVVSSPNVGSVSNTLTGVAAISPNDIWAVGYYNSGTASQTLTMHWNGTQWSIMPSPNPGTANNLTGVSAISTNDVWAVGNYVNMGPQSLALHWDGMQWTQVACPSPGSNYANLVNGVGAISSNDVWIVGFYRQYSPQGLFIHWNGSQWSHVIGPNSPTINSFADVAGAASNDVWAVGGALSASPSPSVVFHWDGTQWSQVSCPNVGYLHGVDVVTANDVWAVGESGTIHWDGSQWSAVPSPNATLYDVDAIAANDIWAVGGSTVGWNALHWNGTQWSVVSNPVTDTLKSVSAISSTDVWAVGSRLNAVGVSQTLVERYAGSCLTPSPSSTPGLPTITNTPISATRTNTSVPTPTLCPINFTDVHPSDYFFVPVQYLFCQGVISGYGTEFRPYNNTSRGQLCKIVVLGFNLTFDTAGGPHFTDVPASNVFYPYVETLYNRTGHISGYGTEFRPYDNVSRGQLSKIVVLTAEWALRNPSTATFTDVPIGSTYFTYVETAYCHGIISGYGTLFKPNDPATRGQISKIVYLALTSTTVCP